MRRPLASTGSICTSAPTTVTDSPHSQPVTALADASLALAQQCSDLCFSAPSHVYNPLHYALTAHLDYLCRCGGLFAAQPGGVLFVGMNPGPWGMAQTGVPFGEVAAVRDWLGICDNTGKPADEHPARPVQGFACPRSEVSGRRLWGLFKQRFGTAESFFAEHFVLNYCPLMFLQSDGNKCRNLTPDKLPASETAPLFAACDDFLRLAVEQMQPKWLIGVGAFAEKQIVRTFAEEDASFTEKGGKIGRILHPSPASPASRDFADKAAAQLIALGIWR